MKILITGANGQLGSEIKELAEIYNKHRFVFSDLPDLDICDYTALCEFVSEHKIEAIINCAAYTAVDKAETDTETAEKVNAIAVENLVKAMQTVQGKLIQISTDYVFDGTNHKPYVEGDMVNPLGVYGSTKLKGEQKVLAADINGIVIRTSWLYSSFGNNFVKTMLRLGNERPTLNVIYDQVGTPTYAKDLAVACLEILSNNEDLTSKGKLYHYSNEGVASWYDFAKAIMEFGGVNCDIKPIETKDYPTPAKRPFYSLLNKDKIKAAFQIEIPYWRDSLKTCVQKLRKIYDTNLKEAQ